MKKRGIPTNLLLAICYKIAYLKLNYNYDTGLTKKKVMGMTGTCLFLTQVINKRCRKIISGVNKQKSIDDGFS